MLARVSDILDEAVMGFLALAALSLGLAPFLFNLPHGIEVALDFAEWAIIGVFALEFAVKFALSRDRRKFVLDPWRLLDAAIIAAALLSLLPMVSDAARSAPALRILMLFRILLFGPRIGHGLREPAVVPQRPAPGGEPQVTMLHQAGTVPRESDWKGLLQWVAAPTSDWAHACNVSPERQAEFASAAGVPRHTVEAALHESSYPRLESMQRWTALAVSIPSTDEDRRRDSMLLLVNEDTALSIAAGSLGIPPVPAESSALPFGPSCALHVIRLALARNEDLAGRLERTVRQLERVPASESPDSFFEQTIRLKRVLSTAKADLWRLRGLLEMLADGRRSLPGLGPDRRGLVSPLIEEAEYLYETIDSVRESVLSLIELHIDIAAHDTNRFMRLLAIVSMLALIPAVAGGLLGMNLAEAPWPMTLGQVAFGTLVVTLVVLYTFMAKGWLR